MKAYKNRKAFTIVEILIVLTVILVLASMIITVATRVTSQAKEKLTEATIGILNSTIEQFRDFEYNYNNPTFAAWQFPVDCTDDTLIADIVIELGGALNLPDPNLWCFFLSKVPDCKKTMANIDDSLKVLRNITIGGTPTPYIGINDPWKRPLRYQYYPNSMSFPVITSAGPDGQFATRDDITSQ